MDTTMPIKQRGISFGGFLVGAFFLVIIGIFGLKLIPAYMENALIKSVFDEMARAPEFKSATAHDIQVAFGLRTSINNIKAIKPDEIDIANEQGKLVLSASYFVKVPLAGNVSLYLDFNPTSTQ